jgi:hypothetical protein
MKFYGEPNQVIKKQSRKPMSKGFIMKPLFRFDANGEYDMPDDHPLIDRMKRRFRYEEVEAVTVTKAIPETFKLHCKKCGYGSNNYGELMAHIRAEHHKGVS